MKKLLCFLLCLTLIFSSVSLSFAAGWSDSQISSVVTDLSTIKTTLNNIYNKVNTITGYLYADSHSIAYWTSAIASWMQPIYAQLTSGLVSETDILPIVSGLNELTITDGNTSYYPYLRYLKDYLNSLNNELAVRTFNVVNWTLNGNGQVQNQAGVQYDFTTAMVDALNNLKYLTARSYRFTYDYLATGYNSTQYIQSFNDLNSTYSFTPSSVTDGIYKYLNALNTPIARLSYVLASDERIEAQEAASANEQAVVDNFIDSYGDGATSTSDIGSMSDLSSGYKQNFGSDASPSGIFDIFNSDHATWFSQETKNQLDTTTPTRLTKGLESETPLLDKQIEDIYNALGVKQP